MVYQTIQVRFTSPIYRIELHRPQSDNTLNQLMIDECLHALSVCTTQTHIVVLEGSTEVFCLGADFNALATDQPDIPINPERLYELWEQLAYGPFISIAHVRGKANAGGVGFTAACDIVLADKRVEFSLSELLFGLFPACVLPFLIRRIGWQKAHYMTLTTKAITLQNALDWGLVDAAQGDSQALLRKYLLRLRHLSKSAISDYKHYMNGLHPLISSARKQAVAANRELFDNPNNLENIYRYARTGQFPWEA
uniref:PedL n=1 Tax=symbiont bacterium of Paederus fuscipes TaxID=176282 RepID=Q5I691_UNCXX|nr:PedL [symbiont bacterium of Paederus fuscipes]